MLIVQLIMDNPLHLKVNRFNRVISVIEMSIMMVNMIRIMIETIWEVQHLNLYLV